MAMQTKLTLRLDSELIERAKAYSNKTGKSLSSIVADLFELLGKNEKTGHRLLPPEVQSLLGIIKDKKVNEKAYRKHLEKKYL